MPEMDALPSNNPNTPATMSSLTLSTLPEPAFIGSKRLPITFTEKPPSDLRGYAADGIEYYCCCNRDCHSVWAIQWMAKVRRKLVHGSLDLDSYKTVAVSKICGVCKAVIRKADDERKRRFEEYRAKSTVAEASVAGASGGRGVEEGLTALATLSAKMATLQVGDRGVTMHNALSSTAALYEAQHKQTQRIREAEARSGSKPTATTPTPLVFEDVPLSPPPPVKEDPALLAVNDPTWDVVEDEDANEDWAVINHFGNPAIHHRDAHVDTPCVRP